MSASNSSVLKSRQFTHYSPSQFIEAFLAAYPILAVCNQSSSFAYQLLYALGKSRFHDQFEHLAGFHLTYAPPPPPTISKPLDSSDSLVKSSVNGLLRMSSRLLSHSFSVGLFFAQFYDVFDSEGRGRSAGRDAGNDAQDPSFSSSVIGEYSQRILKRLDTLIAPPKMNGNRHRMTSRRFSAESLSVIEGRPVNGQMPFSNSSFSSAPSFTTFPIAPVGVTPTMSSADSGALCPICRQRRENETALSVSGFVFCYKCILSYLKAHGVCPVTKLPAKTSNLVRLYPGF